MDYSQLLLWHKENKEEKLFGRYITARHIAPLLNTLPQSFQLDHLGESVQGKAIHSLTWGQGSIRILGWSQMHGNESTTTKAVFDLFKWLHQHKDTEVVRDLFQRISLKIIPMLNPDGAEAYTRVNANKVDLNRDAQERTQPESILLREVYQDFKPDLCLNLHGQRTIFGVGDPAKSATVSFLSPAQDDLRMVTQSRKKGMAVIARLAEILETFIQGQIGRYDDGFNINCVGDTLQRLNIPTILFEAGHYHQDYDREQTRGFMFLSLLGVLESVALRNWEENVDSKFYFSIPENEKCFYDIIIRNIQSPQQGIVDVAIQYEETLKNEGIQFIPKVSQIAGLEAYKGHQEYDFEGEMVEFPANFELKEGVVLEEIAVKGKLSTTFSLKS